MKLLVPLVVVLVVVCFPTWSEGLIIKGRWLYPWYDFGNKFDDHAWPIVKMYSQWNGSKKDRRFKFDVRFSLIDKYIYHKNALLCDRTNNLSARGRAPLSYLDGIQAITWLGYHSGHRPD